MVAVEGRRQALEVGRPWCPEAGERDFVEVVHLTVVIEIHDEKAVAGANPAGVFPEAVAVHVEERFRLGESDEVDTVAVEVNDERKTKGVRNDPA